MIKREINKSLSLIDQIPLWANNLKYQHVFDYETNSIRTVQDVIGYNIDHVLAIRSKSKISNDSNARFRCIACNAPLILLSKKDRSSFYFKHKMHVESCPIKDENLIPQNILRAKKFNGRQESTAHIYMKVLLEKLLSCDKRFSCIKLEEVKKDKETLEIKRPDVSCLYKDQKFVFEIQLSTELQSVIEKRRAFYKKNNTILVWVFQQFSFDTARISDLDIAYSNNQNIIVLDDEAVEKTILTKKLHLSCYWRQPLEENNKITYKTEHMLVEFSQFTKDLKNNKFYYFDFLLNDKNLKENLYKNQWKHLTSNSQVSDSQSIELIKNCYGIHIEDSKNISKLLQTIWSGRIGSPSGWRFKNNTQIFHHLFNQYPKLIIIYIITYSHFREKYNKNNQNNTLLRYNIKEKVNIILKDIYINKYNSIYYPLSRDLNIIEAIFPYLYGVIKQDLAKILNNTYILPE